MADEEAEIETVPETIDIDLDDERQSMMLLFTM